MRRITPEGEIYLRVVEAITRGVCSNPLMAPGLIDAWNLSQQISHLTQQIMTNLQQQPMMEEVDDNTRDS